MAPIRIIDALAHGLGKQAAHVVFEYMAMTEGECGRPVPRSLDELNPVLAAECGALAATYRTPGVVLLACVGRAVIGCVGLKSLPVHDALEVKRLYVRAPYQRRGAGRALMLAAHEHASRAAVTCLVLDVLPSRTGAIACYRSLGYTEVAPSLPMTHPMLSMRRDVPPAKHRGTPAAPEA